MGLAIFLLQDPTRRGRFAGEAIIENGYLGEALRSRTHTPLEGSNVRLLDNWLSHLMQQDREGGSQQITEASMWIKQQRGLAALYFYRYRGWVPSSTQLIIKDLFQERLEKVRTGAYSDLDLEILLLALDLAKLHSELFSLCIKLVLQILELKPAQAAASTEKHTAALKSAAMRALNIQVGPLDLNHPHRYALNSFLNQLQGDSLNPTQIEALRNLGGTYTDWQRRANFCAGAHEQLVHRERSQGPPPMNTD
jgi:hypothetical protein